MPFTISGLPTEPFSPLFGLPEAQLAALGVRRLLIDEPRCAPCRITLRDAAPGESVLLLNYEHQAAASPYRSAHAIFVREAATTPADLVDEIPDAFMGRILSLRAFDEAGMITDADLCEGAEASPLIERLLSDPVVSYIHAHSAKRGCFFARIDRA